MQKVVILGGGISGLSLAWFLRVVSEAASVPLRITILERSCRSGGWIFTDSTSGHVLEHGPRGFRPSGKGVETLKLVESLGLEKDVVRPAESGMNRFLYHDRKLQQLPSNFISLVFRRPSVMKGVIRSLFKEPFQPKGLWVDESIYSFISRRFGGSAVDIVDGMVSGIYAGDIRKLSMRSCFPVLWHFEKNKGSVLKGMLRGSTADRSASCTKNSSFVQKMKVAPQVSFRKGMGHLSKKLSERLGSLPNVKIHHDTHVLSISHSVGSSANAYKDIVVHTRNGEHGRGTDFEANHIFSTLTSSQLSELLPGSHRLLKTKLDKLCGSVSVAVINLVYDIPNAHRRDGFGYLVPSVNKEDILGVAWDSSIFPSQTVSKFYCNKTEGNAQAQEHTRLTVMMGGAHNPHIAKLKEDRLVARAIEKVEEHMGITKTPCHSTANRMENCIPQYYVGHHQRLAAIEKIVEETIPFLTPLGTSFYGVGIADSVFAAKRAAEVYCESLSCGEKSQLK